MLLSLPLIPPVHASHTLERWGGNTGWGAIWEPPFLGAMGTNQLRNAA